MRRDSIAGDKVLMSKVRGRYYSRSCDRGEVFAVSDQEVASASLSLQRKLEQNARMYGSSEVKNYKRIMISEEKTN